MSALIIGNGNNVNKNIVNDEVKNIEFVLCADGGLQKVEYLNLTPDAIIGDFDSIDELLLKKYESDNIKIIKYPVKKDYTDMELAIDYVAKLGFEDIVIIGASGSRLDHTVANILLLEKYYKQGINIKIIDNNNIIQLVYNGMEIINKKNYFVSIIPITDIEGLSLYGFKYPLNNKYVQRGSTLCISNEIDSEKGIIELHNGLALIFISKD